MAAPNRSSVRWLVATLVGGFAFVSYIERMNISVAAALMMPELHLGKIEMGQVFSSFLWGYAIFQIPAGRIGDAIGPRLTLTVAAVLWGITTVLTGLLPGMLVKGTVLTLATLFVIRFLLGAAEGATFPVGSRAIRNWTPRHERALGNSIMVAGSSLAAAAASPLVSWIMVHVGWRSAFYLTSLAAFAIGLVWYVSVTDDPAQHKHVSPAELDLITHDHIEMSPNSERVTPLLKVLSDRRVVMLSLGYTCEGYVLFIFVFWLYIYLIEVRGFSMLRGGIVAGLPWIVALICSPFGGLLCDRIAARRGRIAGARFVIMLGYGLSGALLFAAAMSQNRIASVAALCLSVGFLYFAEPAFWATAAHLAGKNAGAASGMMNTAGILGGIVSTSLVPVMVKHFGWTFALASGAVVALACTCTWLVIGGRGFSEEGMTQVRTGGV